MLISCCLCPTGNIMGEKPPLDNQSITHTYCRPHYLKTLELHNLMTEDEKMELKCMKITDALSMRLKTFERNRNMLRLLR